MDINVLYHHPNNRGIMKCQVGDGDFLMQEPKDRGITGGSGSKVTCGIRNNITKGKHDVVYTFFTYI